MRTAATVAAVLLLAGLAAAWNPAVAGRTAELCDADRTLEHYLLNAMVTGSEEIGSGITRPLRLELELDGVRRPAAFKSVDQQIIQLTRFKTADPEFNFTDNHAYERAAYLMDRMLGLHMVPVAVLREIDGREGAVIEWVGDAVSEHERRESGEDPPDHSSFLAQRRLMRIFDVLIQNTDRNLSNQLITPADWKLHLIDHSRAFRLHRKIPRSFLDEPISLPRWLLDRLKGLEERTLRTRLKGLLSRAQIRALLARRNRIVEKIEEDRERYGDGMVLLEPTPATEERAPGD